MKDKISKQDEKFLEMFGWEEEPGFSVEHNKRVIAETIKKNEKLRAARQREYDETLRERSSATARYLKSLEQGKAGDIEGYFGKKYLAYLRGQQIVDKLKKLKGIA